MGYESCEKIFLYDRFHHPSVPEHTKKFIKSIKLELQIIIYIIQRTLSPRSAVLSKLIVFGIGAARLLLLPGVCKELDDEIFI